MSCPSCHAEITVPTPRQGESTLSQLPESPKANPFADPYVKPLAPHSGDDWIHNLRRLFLYCLLGCFVVGALTALISLQSAAFGKFQSKILLTTLSFGVYSLTGLCCALLADNSPYKMFGGIGIAASIVGALFAFLTNWEIVTGWELLIRGRFSFLIIAISFAHAALLLMINSTNSGVRFVRNVTLAMIAVVAILFLSMAINPDSFGYAWVLVSSFVVVDVLGTVATPILHLATRGANHGNK